MHACMAQETYSLTIVCDELIDMWHRQRKLNGNCGSKGAVGHLLGCQRWKSHTHGFVGLKCGFRYRWSSHSFRKTWTLLRFWWRCSRLVQILLDGSISMYLLQWCHVGNYYNPLRSSSRISTGASPVSSLLGRCHPYRRQARFQCTFVRRRSADLRSHTADVLRRSGDSHVHLRHWDQLMDGKQPFEAPPIKDRADMVGFVAPVETLPSWTNYSWCPNQTNTARSAPWRDDRQWANDGESYQPPHPHVLLSSTSTTCGEEKPNYGHCPLTNQGAGA